MSRNDDNRLPHSPGLPNVLQEKKSQMLPHSVLPNEQSCVQQWFKWTVGWGLEITIMYLLLSDVTCLSPRINMTTI